VERLPASQPASLHKARQQPQGCNQDTFVLPDSFLLPCVCPSLQVGVNYDPMIAKVITSGPDRATALASLHTALQQLQARWPGAGHLLLPLAPAVPALSALPCPNKLRCCLAISDPLRLHLPCRSAACPPTVSS
jgi:hypothetical protein